MNPQFCSVLVIILTCSSFATGELLIAQVVEGSGLNKIAVFTNRGSTSVDLNEYTLWTAINGREWAKNVEPLARKSLRPGESFTLCNPGVSKAAIERCDATPGDLKFNGNDALGLSRGGEFVDLFGDEGGMGWNARGDAFRIGGVDEGSLDHTAVRKEVVTRGNTNWAVSSRLEWDVLPKGTFLVDGNTIVLRRTTGGGTPSGGSTPDGLERVCKQKSGTEIGSCEGPTRTGQDRRLDKRELVIGTFNPEWLFDGESDTVGRWQCNHEGAALHLQAVAGIIRRNGPDILSLQEVEDCTRLAELAGLLPGYEGYLVQGNDTALRQDTALLTRIDPSDPLERTEEREGTPAGSKCGARDESTGVSKHFVARFPSLDGVPFKFAIIGVHLKAFPTDEESCAQREGQAKVIQNEARRLIDEGYEVAIMGDVNDLSDLHRVRTCSRETKPTSRVLSMFRDLNNDGVDDLRNAIEFVPVNERYSSRYVKKGEEEERLSLIDHVLLTPKLWGLVDRVWIDHTGVDMPREARVSDHWPILVALRTDGAPGSGVVVNAPPCV